MRSQKTGFQKGRIRISHVDNLSLAEKIRDLILERFPQAEILVYEARGLCSYYAESGGVLVGVEGNLCKKNESEAEQRF